MPKVLNQSTKHAISQSIKRCIHGLSQRLSIWCINTYEIYLFLAINCTEDIIRYFFLSQIGHSKVVELMPNSLRRRCVFVSSRGVWVFGYTFHCQTLKHWRERNDIFQKNLSVTIFFRGGGGFGSFSLPFNHISSFWHLTR